MANKVIKFSSDDLQIELNSAESYEVYKDISMESIQNTNIKQEVPVSNFKIADNVNVEAIKKSIHNCFSWELGQRILFPEFGSKLRECLYNGITDFNIELIQSEIRKCILKWEPRVVINEINNVSIVKDFEDNTVQLQIIYSIPSLSKEQFEYTYYYRKTT